MSSRTVVTTKEFKTAVLAAYPTAQVYTDREYVTARVDSTVSIGDSHTVGVFNRSARRGWVSIPSKVIA